MDLPRISSVPYLSHGLQIPGEERDFREGIERLFAIGQLWSKDIVLQICNIYVPMISVS